MANQDKISYTQAFHSILKLKIIHLQNGIIYFIPTIIIGIVLVGFFANASCLIDYINSPTFNGMLPRPEIRQSDYVLIWMVNNPPIATTAHGYGITIPNTIDGVAGVFQDETKLEISYSF